MEEERRVLAFPNGDEGEVYVSRIDPGRFRIENFLSFSFLSDNFPEDLPENAGVGWVIEVDELEDGRLQVRQIVPDPNVECVNGFLIPPDFTESPEFQNVSTAIISLGGKWKVSAGGIFSAYVPKRSTKERKSSLEINRYCSSLNRPPQPSLREGIPA
jgi:hypothetical protein